MENIENIVAGATLRSIKKNKPYSYLLALSNVAKKDYNLDNDYLFFTAIDKAHDYYNKRIKINEIDNSRPNRTYHKYFALREAAHWILYETQRIISKKEK